FSENLIRERIEEMALEIARVNEENLLIISLLRGSFVFTADLIRALFRQDIHPQIDFMTLVSYGNNRESSGKVEIIADVREKVEGRNIIILDDILESGRTLHFAVTTLKLRGARSVRAAVLLEKPGKRKFDIMADFIGFKVPDKFII